MLFDNCTSLNKSIILTQSEQNQTQNDFENNTNEITFSEIRGEDLLSIISLIIIIKKLAETVAGNFCDKAKKLKLCFGEKPS